MTIPTRPAPPPPQNNHLQQQNVGVNRHNQSYSKITITLPPPPSSKTTKIIVRQQNVIENSNENNNNGKSITRHFPPAKTRYAPSTNWIGASFESVSNNASSNGRKPPPPRPPPPKVSLNKSENKLGSVKSSRTPQSVNVLSNLFGRKKSPVPVNNGQKQPPIKVPQLSSYNSINNHTNSLGSSNSLFYDWSSNQNQGAFSSGSNISPHNFDSNDVQLISFDSPPNSPTFTQKSNSDCVSVDSFSSDSNFSSPHNGSASQTESGFEDDFSTTIASGNSTQLTTPVDPWDILNEPKSNNAINSSGQLNYMHLNNMKNIDAHPIRNLHILQRKNNENNSVLTASAGKTTVSQPQKLGMPTIIRPKIQKGVAPKPPIQNELKYFYQSNNISTKNFETTNTKNNLENSFDDEDPPMPNCPPPPPPSNLQSIDFNFESSDLNDFELDDSLEPSYGIAMYDFDGIEDGDLSLRQNEKIYLISRVNDEWFMGKNKKGCEGIFPISYIDVKVPLNHEDGGEPKRQNAEKIENKNKLQNSSKNINNLVKVLYSFEASEPEDLTITENDMVKVLYRINDDWLYGENNNKQGQFPANFIEKIPDNLISKMP